MLPEIAPRGIVRGEAQSVGEAGWRLVKPRVSPTDNPLMVLRTDPATAQATSSRRIR